MSPIRTIRFRSFLTRLAHLCFLPALLAGPRPAAAAAIQLGWNDCGFATARGKSFSCGTTTGTDVLVASFIPPGGMNQFLGLVGTLEVQTAQSTLPPWWELQGPGACRAGSLSASFDFAGYAGCADFWASRNVMGGMSYDAQYEGANRGRIRVICAVPEDQRGPVAANSEFYAFRLSFNHAKSSGAGACAGCAEPACISLTAMLLSQPAGVGDHTLTASGGNALVTWQGGTCASATRTGTWGKLKSIYR